MDQASQSSTLPEDDILINRVVGRDHGLPDAPFDLDGARWPSSSTLDVRPTVSCADSDDLASVAGAELLLMLAGKDNGDHAREPLACADVLPFGQSLRYSWIKTIAKNCPISMCAHNTDSESERIF